MLLNSFIFPTIQQMFMFESHSLHRIIKISQHMRNLQTQWILLRQQHTRTELNEICSNNSQLTRQYNYTAYSNLKSPRQLSAIGQLYANFSHPSKLKSAVGLTAMESLWPLGQSVNKNKRSHVSWWNKIIITVVILDPFFDFWSEKYADFDKKGEKITSIHGNHSKFSFQEFIEFMILVQPSL